MTASKKNPFVENLKEQIRKLTLRVENEEELRHRAEGKLEKYQEQEEKQKEERHLMFRRNEEYREELQSQVLWLRRFIEDLTIPKEKIEMLVRARRELVESRGSDFMPQMERRYR